MQTIRSGCFWLTVSLLFLVQSNLASAESSRPLRLRDCIEMALRRGNTLRSSQLRLQISNRDRDSAENYVLPSLDVTANQGVSKTIAGEKTEPERLYNNQFSLTLSEKIYDSGEGKTRLDLAKLEERQSALKLKQAQEEVALAVSRAWFDLAGKITQEAMKQQRNSLVEKQFAATERQYKEGLKTRKDFLRFKSELQRSRIDLVAIQSDIVVAKSALLRAMSQPLDAPLSFYREEPQPNAYTAFVSDLSRDIKQFSNLPEHALAEIDIKSAELAIDLARQKNAPNIQLGTQLNYGANDFIGTGEPFADHDRLTWGVTLGLTYNIWDFGSRRNEISNAVARKELASLQLDSLQQDLNLKVRNLLETIRKGVEAVRLNHELLGLETESFAQLEQSFKLGQLGFLDYITGVTDLLNAKSNHFMSYYGLLNDLATYHYYNGSLNEFLAHF